MYAAQFKLQMCDANGIASVPHRLALVSAEVACSAGLVEEDRQGLAPHQV